MGTTTDNVVRYFLIGIVNVVCGVQDLFSLDTAFLLLRYHLLLKLQILGCQLGAGLLFPEAVS